MRKEQVLLAVLLVGTAVFLAGCVAAVVAAGVGAAGTVAYIMGDLAPREPVKLEAVHEATLKAVEQLGLKVTKTDRDALSSQIVLRDAEDKKIIVKLRASTPETTKVTVRVGTFGDETKSRLIYQKIHDNLKQEAGV